jgi:ribonucleoside-diphosphate reductase alpha chain
VLAPTGTIAFMMDADTTGVEPDIALVKYKKLAGGGMLKIVNGGRCRWRWSRSATSGGAARAILAQFIDEHDTIEGAPGLRPRAPAGLRLRLPAGQRRPSGRSTTPAISG